MATPTLQSLQPHCPYRASTHEQAMAAAAALDAAGHHDMVGDMLARCFAADSADEIRQVIADCVVIDPPGGHDAPLG